MQRPSYLPRRIEGDRFDVAPLLYAGLLGDDRQHGDTRDGGCFDLDGAHWILHSCSDASCRVAWFMLPSRYAASYRTRDHEETAVPDVAGARGNRCASARADAG